MKRLYHVIFRPGTALVGVPVDVLSCAVAVLVDAADFDIEIQVRAVAEVTIPFAVMPTALVLASPSRFQQSNIAPTHCQVL